MNNKTKIMLGLSALTAGTLAAGATGTLAWFTTNKTAKATYTSIKAQGTQGTLNVAIDAVTTNSHDSSNDAGNATADGTLLSDVSSKDGLNFYQPDWTSVSGNEASFNSIQNVSTKEGYFTQFTVTVSIPVNDANKDKLDISLLGLTITGTAGQTLADWTRVAVNTVASKDTSKNFLKTGAENETYLFQNTITDKNSKYITSAKTGAGKMTDAGVLETATPTVAKEVLDTKITPKTWKNKVQGDHVTMGVSVWLEGTMEDNQDTAKDKMIGVSLIFGSELSKTNSPAFFMTKQFVKRRQKIY